MKKKTHKLNLQQDFDFLLIGIASHENDYRLSWALNEELSALLVKSENLIVQSKHSPQNQSFSQYIFDDSSHLRFFRLISNRCSDGFLLEEHTKIDYVLVVSGETNEELRDNLLKSIKQIPIVISAFSIDVNTLKSKHKLIF